MPEIKALLAATHAVTEAAAPMSTTSTDHGRSHPEERAGQMPLLQSLARRGDLILAALVVAVIALLVVPLPTPLLDALIAINLAASIALLMLSLYIPSALGLSTFPSLLLLTTLFRLSLNIASTKLILLDADAGQVIDTFGRLVVGGNVVVGLVVFLIIAIVQFIVVAKGAERVAEVGARFTLDGMPGKQMSIDADLRAGIVDRDEAQRRRREIEQESQLHGAMDGAMKFVKGDAIAGIIIAFVNIVAGIVIGVVMHDMTLGAAVHAYAVLSVGDGMVSQIPSLLVSIAAGIVITRVDGKFQARTYLGAQIAQQMLAHPRALLVAGGVIATFLLVPGLPFWPFLGLAVLLAGAGYLAQPGRNRQQSLETSALPAPVDEQPAIAAPLRLRLSPSLRPTLSSPRFDAALDEDKARIWQELGLPFPVLSVAFDPRLTAERYAIDVQEVQVAEGDLRADNVVSIALPRESETPGGSEDGTVAHERTLANLIARAVRLHAESFIGMQEVHVLLSRAARQLPDLIAELQRAVTLQRTTEVLRRLVQEGVSIRCLREIGESLITWVPREKDIVLLTEYVRVDLGRFIAARHVDASNVLRAVMLDAEVEKGVREAIQQGAGGSFLALAPETAMALTAGADAAFGPLGREAELILVTPMDVRRYLKKFLGTRYPSLVVLSFQELPAHIQIQSIGRLSLQHAPQRRSA